MLGITLSLGVWQVERLRWKRGLLSEIDRAEASPPIPLSDPPVPFEKVEVTGTFRPDLAAHYGTEVRSTAAGAQLGSQLVVPLDRPGKPVLLIDRGWLPDDTAPKTPAGPVTLTGYVRPAETGNPFAPGPDQAARRFWSLDPAVIGRSLGLASVEPYTVVLLGPATASPMPAQALPRPPNDHLGYAATWFGLSACLIAVFAIYVRRTLRA